MKFTLLGKRVFDSNRDGAPLVDKRGKPFKRVFLTFDSEVINDKDWQGSASYLDYNNDSDNWNDGVELEGDIVKRQVGDKVFWNFYKVRPNDLLAEQVKRLEERVSAIEEKLSSQGSSGDTDLPF